MADETTSETKPELTADQVAAQRKSNAIAVWHDADTDDKKRAAVKQFPELVSMDSAAQNYK